MAGAGGLANEIRAGLERTVSVVPQRTERTPKDPLDEVWVGKSVRQHVKEFGAVFGTIFFAICAVKLYRGASIESGSVWFGLGAVTAALGYLAPNVLRPLWRGWMKLAHYLSIVMTFVILGVCWTIGFIPMAYLVRILGIKAMDLSYRSGAESYWEKRDIKFDDFKRLEQQY